MHTTAERFVLGMPAATQTEMLSRGTVGSGNVAAMFVDETKGAGYPIGAVF
jgi:hypothetical protein